MPIVLPDTICIQERLPPGAAAVLINRTHTYRDLVLPISAVEKRLLDVVDGSRSIGGIVAMVSPLPEETSPSDLARRFFERLWWWDQVVMDTSRQSGG